MTDTQRVTTAREGGTVNPRIAVLSALPATPQLSRSEPLQTSVSAPICQGKAVVGLTARRRGRSSTQRRITFAEIRSNVRSLNIARLKDHAFAANRLAKITIGTSRSACYRVKSRCINALLRNGAAVVSELEVSFGEPKIGVAFEDGGRLHTKPSCLDSRARNALHQQLTMVIDGGKNSIAGIASL